MDDRYRAIQQDPRFQALVEERGKLATVLSAIMLVIYYGFILLIAFAPGILGAPLGGGVITVGIPVGIFVIVSAFVLTAIYVWKANTTFDELTRQLLRERR